MIRTSLAGRAFCAVAVCSALAAPSAVAAPDTVPAPPQGCTPTSLAAAAASGSTVCVHRLLVTETTNTEEQNHTTFTVTDHVSTLTATVPNWWPSSGPVAGMVITMWGHTENGVFKVDRWIDLTHGTGPAPDGPYQRFRAIDVSAGRVPEHRMVWIATYVFLLDPQNGGDGDIHAQTANGCPGAGVTTETTPPLRGYVDHPALPGLKSSTDRTDEPSNHMADAPPVGVPVMILGATRYDYGFGWWELHPIRAWRFLTSTELKALQAECAANPVPELDRSGPAPVPFGFPPCTDGSEFGNAPGYVPCKPQCYVSHTAIGQLETLTGPCAGITPVLTPSQEPLSTTGTSSTPSHPPPSSGGHHGGGSGSGHPGAGEKQWGVTLTHVYGHDCRRLRDPHGRRGRAFRLCVLAMARLAGGETHSPRFACGHEPRHRPARRRGHRYRGSYYARCVAAGRQLLHRLSHHRVSED